MKIKVTETQKWHIAGYIIETQPSIPQAPTDYFEALERQREREEQEEEEKRGEKKEEVEEIIETIYVKTKPKEVAMHFLGIALLSVGLYLLMRSAF